MQHNITVYQLYHWIIMLASYGLNSPVINNILYTHQLMSYQCIRYTELHECEHVFRSPRPPGRLPFLVFLHWEILWVGWRTSLLGRHWRMGSLLSGVCWTVFSSTYSIRMWPGLSFRYCDRGHHLGLWCDPRQVVPVRQRRKKTSVVWSGGWFTLDG